MVSAELLRLPRRIPPTVPALRAYLDEVMASGILRMTDGARRVADLFGDPPRVPQRPLWGLISFLAFQTLPPTLRRLYQVPEGPARRALLRASLLGLRLGRPWPRPASASSPPPSWPAGAWRAATGRWPRRPPTGRPARCRSASNRRCSASVSARMTVCYRGRRGRAFPVDGPTVPGQRRPWAPAGPGCEGPCR